MLKLGEEFQKAIFDSGSNENGNYIKYADGTMICTQKYSFKGDMVNSTSVNGMLVSSKLTLPTFPIEFLEEPIVNVTMKNNTWNMFIVCDGDTPISKNSAGSWRVMRVGSASTITIHIEVIAIGRWK